jgi:N-methylhydantoinase A
VWSELAADAQAWLDGEQVLRERQRFERSADLRYEHQSFELTCSLGDGPLTRERLQALTSTFHAEHRRLYTYDLPSATVELVNLRVTAIGLLPKRAALPEAASAADTREAVVAERRAYFRGPGVVAVPVYARARLRPGTAIPAPAIVDQDDTTCLVAPGFRARVDRAHNLLLERSDG